VVALSSLDGDIEHTQREYLTMTYSCEKMGICNAKAEILYRARKKQYHCRTRGRKKCRKEKSQNRRYINNAQRRKIARISWHNQEMTMIYANNTIVSIK